VKALFSRLIGQALSPGRVARATAPVLLYHSVADDAREPSAEHSAERSAEPFAEPSAEPSRGGVRSRLHRVRPAHLRAQLEELGRHWDIVSLETLLALDDPRGRAAITFDDGYRSVFDEGLAVLEALRIPATIFVCADHLEGTPSWRDGLRRIVELGLEEAFVRAHPDFAGDGDLLQRTKRSGVDPARVLKAVERFLRDTPDTGGWGAESDLPARAEEIPDHPLLRLGNHGGSHSVMASLSVEAQRDEILRGAEAIGRLAVRRGANPHLPVFALPFGGRRHWNRDTLTALRMSGHTTLLLAGGRLNRGFRTIESIRVLDRVLPSEGPLFPDLARRWFKGGPVVSPGASDRGGPRPDTASGIAR